MWCRFPRSTAIRPLERLRRFNLATIGNRGRAALAILVLLAGATATGRARPHRGIDPGPPGPTSSAEGLPGRRPNVVLVFIDTVRADHVGAYGYARPTTPRLDRFAASAVQFDRAYAQAPNTPRSFPSILTGRWPSQVAWRKRFANFASVTAANQSIFELFHAAGYRTEAVTAHWYFEIADGLGDGVDAWDNRGALGVRESNDQSAAPDVSARALARLDALAAGTQPFVLMIHYFDPHAAYMPHPEVADFGDALADRYDGELAFVDRHLAPVLDRLERAPLADSTIVAVFSDHGEAFGEHGLYLHGRTLYQEETRVPLLLRVPGTTPRRVPEQVSLIDLLPTLAQLAGVAAPAAEGQSLVPALTGTALPARPVFLEQLPYPAYPVHLVAVIGTTGIKVIRDLTHGSYEAYDLGADPGEKHDLLRAGGAEAARAVAAERALVDDFAATDPDGAASARSP